MRQVFMDTDIMHIWTQRTGTAIRDRDTNKRKCHRVHTVIQQEAAMVGGDLKAHMSI